MKGEKLEKALRKKSLRFAKKKIKMTLYLEKKYRALLQKRGMVKTITI